MKSLQIKKVSFRGDKGVSCTYTHLLKKGVLSKVKQDIVADPFDETKAAMNKLSDYLFRVCGLDMAGYIGSIETVTNKFGDKEYAAVARKTRAKYISRITVNTVTLAYKDDELCGCSIGGIMKNDQDEPFSLKAPYVHLDRETYYGFEKELRKDVEALIKLVTEFLDGNYNVIEQDEPKGEHEEVKNDTPDPFKDEKVEIRTRSNEKKKAA